MGRKRKVVLGVSLVIAIAGLGLGQAALEASARRAAKEAPVFEVDPLWPKPLPNHWILGSTIGVGVDSRDHVFIVHRGNGNPRTELGAAQDPPTGECCLPAPPILEFDPEGNLVNAWGGPGEGYDWPESNHGLTLDHKDNIWIGGNGRTDSHILKFTRDGRFLMQIGQAGQLAKSSARDHFGRVAKVAFDPAANEAYVADGYGNKRVAVIDMDTGELKRYWARTATSRRTWTSGRTTPTRRPPSSSAIPCTARSRPTTGSCTSATGRTTGSRSSARMARSSRKRSSRRARWATARSGTSRSRATRSSGSCTWRTART